MIAFGVPSTGYDVVALVAAGAEAAVGLELSDRAVQEAKVYLEESKQRLNLSEEAAKRVSFVQGDFFTWQPEGGPFDWGYDYTLHYLQWGCTVKLELQESWMGPAMARASSQAGSN
eukprot:scaffold12050_cov18-Tisochrysis_lutea.AAC.1